MNNLKRPVTEFGWDGEEGSINALDEFEDFGDYDSDFIEPERGGKTFSLVPRRLNRNGGRTILTGGEKRRAGRCLSWRLSCLRYDGSHADLRYHFVSLYLLLFSSFPFLDDIQTCFFSYFRRPFQVNVL
jgi:hypothetical protein